LVQIEEILVGYPSLFHGFIGLGKGGRW